MGHSESGPQWEIHSIRGLLRETRKISNKQSNFTLKGTTKNPTKPKVNKRKKIVKIRAEITK